MKLTLPFPPSVNSYWRAPSKGPLKGRHLVSETGRKFQQAARAAIIEQLRAVPRPSSDLAEVHIVLYPPYQRRRDIDDYNKALFDALTLKGVWEDDSQVKRMLVEHYRLRKSKRRIAEELYEKHPDWCFMTCRRRVDTWLSLAESMLYAPMCDAFGTNGDRFYLQSEQKLLEL